MRLGFTNASLLLEGNGDNSPVTVTVSNRCMSERSLRVLDRGGYSGPIRVLMSSRLPTWPLTPLPLTAISPPLIMHARTHTQTYSVSRKARTQIASIAIKQPPSN